MIGYVYDEISKEYKYEVKLQANPKNPAEILMPDNCTTIQPIFATGYATCFIQDEWVQVLDHRQHYQVNLDTLEFTIVTYLGEALTGFQFVSDEVYRDYQLDHEKYKVVDGVFTDISDTEEYQEILRRREAERIAKLSLTKREVFLALYADKGITPEQLEAQITDPAALIEFRYAERYYRGNALIDLIGQKLGYTAKQLDDLFENGSF